MQTKDICSL